MIKVYCFCACVVNFTSFSWKSVLKLEITAGTSLPNDLENVVNLNKIKITFIHDIILGGMIHLLHAEHTFLFSFSNVIVTADNT